MPASTARYKSRPLRRRSFRRDRDAVSEVIGYSLTFGILSMLLVLSVSGFNAATQETEIKVVELRAASAAQRVSTTIVQSSLLAEQQDMQIFHRAIDLPEQMEGRGYTVALGPQAVWVNVTSMDIAQRESTLGAGRSVDICSNVGEISGGAIRLVYGTPPVGGCADPSLYLEEIR